VIQTLAPSANPRVAGVGFNCSFSIDGGPVTLQGRVPDSAAGWRENDVMAFDAVSSGPQQFAARPQAKLIAYGNEYRRYWFTYADQQTRDASYLIDMVLLDGKLGILNVSHTGAWDEATRRRAVRTVAHGYCKSDFKAPAGGQQQ
jgi:hypothetical protein